MVTALFLSLRNIGGNMILVMGTIVVPAAAMADVRGAMKDMMRETWQEEGCVSYNLCEDLIDSGRIRISEEWETMATLEAHFATPHMKLWRAALADAGITERQVVIYDGKVVKPNS